MKIRLNPFQALIAPAFVALSMFSACSESDCTSCVADAPESSTVSSDSKHEISSDSKSWSSSSLPCVTCQGAQPVITPKFTCGPSSESVEVGDSVTWSVTFDEEQEYHPTSYTWNVDDYGASSEKSVTVVYDTPGEKFAGVFVRNGTNGQRQQSCGSVYVSGTNLFGTCAPAKDSVSVSDTLIWKFSPQVVISGYSALEFATQMVYQWNTDSEGCNIHGASVLSAEMRCSTPGNVNASVVVTAPDGLQKTVKCELATIVE